MQLRSSRLRWLLALLAAFALLAGACSDDSDDDGGDESSEESSDAGASGNIDISGSSTVEPVSSLVAEAFSADNPDVAISVDGPGTGDGFELFCAGETDISDASRPIDEEDEVPVCEENGIEFTEFKIGIDGITVLTNPANDAVECVDIPAIYALVGPESTGFSNWSDAADLAGEVGSTEPSEFPDAPLDITGPGEESGTYDSFVEITIEDLAEERGQDAVSRPDYTSSPNDNVIIEGITGSDSSFGWVGYAFFVNNSDSVKALQVADEDGNCIEPTDETIASNEYPISRDLFIYVNNAEFEANTALQDFVDFYINENLETAVADAGYVVLADEDLAAAQDAYTALAG